MKIIIRCAIRKCHIARQVLQFAYLCDRQGEPPARWGFRPDEFRNERSSGTKNCAVACTSWVVIGEEEIHDIVSLFNLALGSVVLRIDCPLSNDQMKLFLFFVVGHCYCFFLFFFWGGCFSLQVFSVNVAVRSKPYLMFQISLNGAGRFFFFLKKKKKNWESSSSLSAAAAAGNWTTRRPHDDRKEAQTAVVWSCFPFIRYGQNHLARHSERGKKTRQREEEVGRQQQGMDWPGIRQVSEGSGEQRAMEKTGCKSICGAPTTLAVKGLMMMMMMNVAR